MSQTLEKVRALYERHPYPRPRSEFDEYRGRHLIPSGSPEAFFHLYWPTATYRENPRILVAGCGTSQAVTFAVRQPEAHVVGIDISDKSLHHCEALAGKCGIRNLDASESAD